MSLELRGESIVLRDFRASDRRPFVALKDDEGMFEYMKFRIDEAFANQQVAYLLQEPHLQPRRTFNLALQTFDTEFAGWAAIGGVTDKGEVEFGWYVRSDQWGRGYATEATDLLLGFAFGELARSRVIATADPENRASIRVLEKAGLANEGLTDPVDTWNKGPRPRLLFAISQDQWNTARRNE